MENLTKKGANTGGNRSFTRLLLRWHRQENKRQMPWKGETDPYKIWLSEIILQQTRVEQGLEYYQRFVQKFPDIRQLAKANDKLIFKLWEGLGYYSRCRNLISTARFISEDLGGRFPRTFDDIRQLRGVGPYTAAAISSFAFNLPHAVIDGNVSRVLSRVFGINKPIDSTEGKKIIASLAGQLLDKNEPGVYNQAIMDFGAVVCKPVAPLCSACVFKKICLAFRNDHVKKLPLKSKRILIKERWFYYFVLSHENRLVIQQRTANDIWNQLYEFPLIEGNETKKIENIINEAVKSGWLKNRRYAVINISPAYKQRLSHQLINARFIQIKLNGKANLKDDQLLVTSTQLTRFPFPRLINEYLNEPGKSQGLDIKSRKTSLAKPDV
jgi:A/G-specific adenine glycosylase